MKKIIFLELFLRIIEDEKWNLFEKLGQLRTPNRQVLHTCRKTSSGQELLFKCGGPEPCNPRKKNYTLCIVGLRDYHTSGL